MATRREDIIRVQALHAADLLDPDPHKVEASMARLSSKLGEVGLDVTKLGVDKLSVPAALTACNVTLDRVDMELKEYEPGRFALVLREVETPEEPEPPATDTEALDGALLCSCLLRTPDCISLLNLALENMVEPLPSVLKTAIGLCNSLKHIYLSGNRFEETADEFTGCLAFLSSIEEFTASSDLSEAAAKNVARMLVKSSSSLRRVRMSCSVAEGFTSVMKALLLCRNLTSLDLGGCNFQLYSAKLLAEFLVGTTHLVSLCVSFDNDACAQVVLGAIQTNPSVKTLKLNGTANMALDVARLLRVNSALDELDLSLSSGDKFGLYVIANALTRNTGLRKLKMKSDAIESDRIISIVNALQENKCLEELDLASFSSATYKELEACALAFTHNTTLVTVRLPEVNMNTEEASKLRIVLKLSRACKRLTTTWNDVGLEQLAAEIESKALKVLHLNFDVSTGLNRLGDVFDAVRRCGHVTHLYIKNVASLPGSSIANLALAFSHSKTLKTVELLSDDDDYDLVDFDCVIDSLKLNTSITRMDFGMFDQNCVDVQLFAEMLKMNRTLHWVVFRSNTLGDGDLNTIGSGLSENYTLLELDLGNFWSRCTGLFRVMECLRRNQMMLNRAVDFVLEPSVVIKHEESKVAFGKLCRKDSLVERMKTVTHQSDAEVREAIGAAASLLLRHTAKTQERNSYG